MYVICWAKLGSNDWEIIDGEDAMQQRVSELEGNGATIVLVFDKSDELDEKEGNL